MTKEQREKRLEFSQHSVGQTSCPSSGDLKKNRKVVTIQIETWEEAAPPRGGGGGGTAIYGVYGYVPL